MGSNNAKYKKKEYIWIDPDIESDLNKHHYYKIFTKRNIRCKKFTNIDEAYIYLNLPQNYYKEFLITISGKLFNELYDKIKNHDKNQIIKFSYKIIVFTRSDNLFINNLKMNNIYYKNDIFDTKLIFTQEFQVSNYIDDIPEQKNDLTFDIIDNIDQLIVPNYYSYLLGDIDIPEISIFNNFLEKNFLPQENQPKKIRKGNKKIHELLALINDKMKKSTVLDYWLRMYSAESDFYRSLNESLRNGDKDCFNYFPFIKLCYEGFKNNYIKSYTNELYRYSKISKTEFSNIQNKLSLSNKNQIPGVIAFSRSFLSFSKNSDNITAFKGADKSTFCILYKIEEIKDFQSIKNKVSNFDMNGISVYEEGEVLILPFSCFEIVKIKEIKSNKVDYEIHLKYLGNYSHYIKEQFGPDFFNKIHVSKFSEELVDSGILQIHNFFSKWEKKDEIFKIHLDKIFFLLENQEDLISNSNNDIIVFNIHSSIIKQKITIHQKKILDIVKLSSNRICSCSEDNTIKIIEFKENNYKFIELHNINLGEQYYAIQINFFFKDNFFCFIDNINNISFFQFYGNKYFFKNLIPEKDKILKFQKLDNDKIIYISENQEGNKLINFINIRELRKENNSILIDEKEQKLKLIDLLIFSYYIIIGYDHRIDIINYKNPPYIIKSLKYFLFEITNITILSSNRIILGTYDSDKNESIIREHLLRVEDLQNNNNIFDCIGLGNLENKKIENIIKINESQILLNVKNESCYIYQKSNELSDKLRQSITELDEIKISNIKYINFKEEEKNSDDDFMTPGEPKLISVNKNKNVFGHKKMKTEYLENNFNIFNQKNKYNNNQINNYKNIKNGNINLNPFRKSSFQPNNKFINDNNIIINNNIELKNLNNINNIDTIEIKNDVNGDKIESNNLISFLPKANNEILEEEKKDEDNQSFKSTKVSEYI